MLNIRKSNLFLGLALLFIFAFPGVAFAEGGALFSELAAKASEIFMGTRDVVYVVAAFGIIGVAIGGIFGNINWKWFGAIVMGLMIISVTSALITYLVGSDAMSQVQITDSLK